MIPVEISKNVYDVGVMDWNIRDFHGYSTHAGTTYNAFLVLDEKVALIDTVKAPFCDQFWITFQKLSTPEKLIWSSATIPKWITQEACRV